MAMWRGLSDWRKRRHEYEVVRPDQLHPITRRQRLARVVMIALGAVVICAYLDGLTRQFDYLEQKAYAERLKVDAQRNRKSIKQATKQIVLVTISDETFKPLSLPGSLPIPRDYHAKVIQELTLAGATVIAFDLLFEAFKEEDKNHKEQDEKLARLAKSAGASGRVLWACKFDADIKQFRLPAPQLLEARGSHWGHTEAQWSYDREPQGPEVVGHRDTVIDSIRPFLEDGDRKVPAFSLEATRLLLELQKQPFNPMPIADGWQVGNLAIPVERRGLEEIGLFRIRYSGDPRKTFQEVPYESIYQTKYSLTQRSGINDLAASCEVSTSGLECDLKRPHPQTAENSQQAAGNSTLL